jgi:protein-S-isoprenylcysteine O-methyltransferase Ste14
MVQKGVDPDCARRRRAQHVCIVLQRRPTSIVLAVAAYGWSDLWNVENTFGRIGLEVLYAFGWLTVLISTFLIHHFDLFGLRQTWLHLLGRPYTTLGFRTPGPYRYVRHPLYVGWLLVFWSTSVMTSAHLVFAIATTAYILVAIQFEEWDLVHSHKEYEEYRRQVPMLLPIPSLNTHKGERAVRSIRSDLF